MNEKFFALPEEKRQAILNAAYRVFSRNSYKNSPMSEIAESAGICFGISAFLRSGSLGTALGLAALLYACNLIANISEKASFLKNVTPFAYCDGADIMSEGRLDGARIAIGMGICLLSILAAYIHYSRKDLR